MVAVQNKIGYRAITIVWDSVWFPAVGPKNKLAYRAITIPPPTIALSLTTKPTPENTMISDSEYDAIQHENRNNPIWGDFRAWLTDSEGVTKTTARTYCTQVRRIIREIEHPITPETLFDWINSRPPGHRTPFRSSWRRYRLFTIQTFGVTVADFPAGSGVPTEVIEALSAIKKRGIGSGTIQKLTTKVNTGREHDALARINRDVENNDLLVCRCSDNSLSLVPREAWNTLFRWGKQDKRVDDIKENPRWLVPTYPGAQESMKAVKITRLVNQLSRKERQK